MCSHPALARLHSLKSIMTEESKIGWHMKRNHGMRNRSLFSRIVATCEGTFDGGVPPFSQNPYCSRLVCGISAVLVLKRSALLNRVTV